MSRRISRRVWGTGVVLGIVLIFLVGVVWWGMAASNKPQLQNQISMPSMAGTDNFLVNLWLDPSPAKVGANTITAQVTTTIGTATPLDSILLHLTRPDGGAPSTVTATKATSSSQPAESFSAPVNFDVPGHWQITIEVHNGDVVRTTTFSVTVKQS